MFGPLGALPLGAFKVKRRIVATVTIETDPRIEAKPLFTPPTDVETSIAALKQTAQAMQDVETRAKAERLRKTGGLRIRA